MINNWTSKTLEELALNQKNAIVDGPFGSNLKLSDYVPEGVPVLQGNNITGNSFRFTDIRFISQEKASSLIRSKVIVGDLLIVKIGSVGYSAIVDDLNGFDYAIIPANLLKVSLDTNKVIPQYVYQYLISRDGIRKLKGMASSTAQPALSLGKVKQFSIPIPEDIKLQQKIGDILSSIDEAIQKTEQILQKKQELKRALLDQVTDRTTGDSISLGDVIKIKNGFAYSGKYMVDEETDTILLTPGNVEIGGGFNFSKLRYFSGEVIRDYVLKHGDIFVALTDLTPQANFLGYPAIVPDLKKTFLHNQRLGLIQVTSNKADIKYIYFLLMTFAYRQHVISTATGTTVKHTSVSKIIDFKFKLPTLDEQKQIAQRIEKIEQDLNLEKKSKNLYLKLKSGLMHDIFNQKIVIN